MTAELTVKNNFAPKKERHKVAVGFYACVGFLFEINCVELPVCRQVNAVWVLLANVLLNFSSQEGRSMHSRILELSKAIF